MKFVKTATLFALLAFSSKMTAQSAHSTLRKADKAYENNDFTTAEETYRRALEKENSTQGTYNLGNSIYRQERFKEAVKQYEDAAESAKDRTTKANAYHNLGNAYFQNKQFKESIDAYKNALRQNPNDLDTKRNLALAMRRLPPPPPPDKQNKQQQQQQKEEQKQEPQKQQEQQPKEQQEQEQAQDLSKEEARDLLEIMDQEEQKVQQKLRKGQSRSGKPKKDW